MGQGQRTVTETDGGADPCEGTAMSELCGVQEGLVGAF